MCYGLSPQPAPMTFGHGLTLDLRPGTITLLTGPSGTGKSALLGAIGDRCPTARRVDRVAFPPDRAVVDAVAAGAPLADALSILTACALSEPRLWLRRFAELSDGEQFRARLARAVGLDLATAPSGPLLCDEFAAILHRRAAKAIAYNLRKLVVAHRLCLVVATSHDDLAADLQPDCIVQTQRRGQAALRCQRPRLGKPFSLQRRLHIEPGRKGDYEYFADMHYRQRDELGFVDRVFLLRDGIGGEPIAIVVYAHPPLELSLRNRATARRFVRNPARLNREMRILRRIVVHPDVRGCGLGHLLVRKTMPMLGVRYVECLAAMGAVNPIFERAGMKRVGVCPIPADRQRLLDEFARLHVDPLSPDFVTRVCRRPTLRRLVARGVFDWYRGTTGGGEARVARQSPRFLAETFRQMIGSRPVYYLWCKHEKDLQKLTLAAPPVAPSATPPARPKRPADPVSTPRRERTRRATRHDPTRPVPRVRNKERTP